MREPNNHIARVGDRLLNQAAPLFRTVRRIRRPENADSPGFDLSYVRTGPVTDSPAVVIPGGPGLASVLPYRSFRRQAARDGLDVIMVEHRGIALSRFSSQGSDLPKSSMWIDAVVDDIAAVLDRENVQRAFIAGSSYGSYLASSFGAKYPERVAGMLLDSALQSTQDIQVERTAIRRLFWNSGSEMAESVRFLVESGEDPRTLLDVIRAGYELNGADLVTSLLQRRLEGRPQAVWKVLENYAARDVSLAGVPGYYEFARAGTIGFRELNYAPALDGHPLDPALTYSPLAKYFPGFVGEPFDLLAAAAAFDWPLALLVGNRDLRTPPAIAERTASLAPHSVLARIENGHSALDTHMLAFEKTLKLLMTHRLEFLPNAAADLSALPRRGDGADLAKLISVLSRVENN